MCRIIFLLLSILGSTSLFAQFVGKVNNDAITYNSNNIPAIIDGAIYFISQNEQEILRLDPLTHQLQSFYKTVSSKKITGLISNGDFICFQTKIGNNSSQLILLDDSKNEHVLYNFMNGNALLNQQFAEGKLYVNIQISSSNYQIHCFDLLSFQSSLIFSESNFLRIENIINGYVLFNRFLTNEREFVAKNETEEHVLLNGSFNQCSITRSNDPNHIYFTDVFSGGGGSTWRTDLSFSSPSYYSSFSAGDLYFQNGRVYAMPPKSIYGSSGRSQFITYEINDTLAELTLPLCTKQVVPEGFQTTFGLNVPSPYFFSKSIAEGFEIGQLNNEDSIVLISNQTLGWTSSVANSNCMSDYDVYGTKSFEWNNRYFFIETAKTGKTYISSITDTGYVQHVEVPNFEYGYLSLINGSVSYSGLDYEADVFSFYVFPTSILTTILNPVSVNNQPVWMTELVLNLANTTNYYCSFEFQNLEVRNTLADTQGNSYIFYRINFFGQSLPKYATIYNSKDYQKDSVFNTSILVKLDSLGNLVWMNNFGNKYGMFNDEAFMFLQENGTLAVLGQYYLKGYFDSTVLARLDQGMYFAQIDVETGKFLNTKNLFEEQQYVFNLDRFLKQDKAGNFYLAGFYNYEINLTDTTLYSDYNKQNVLVKLDANGSFIWACNVLNNWKDFEGRIIDLTFDDYNNRIYTLCAQDKVTSCYNTNTWKGEIISYNLTTGEEQKRISVNGMKLQRKGLKLMVLNNNQVKLMGTFAGSLVAQHLSGATHPIDDCFEENSVELIYDFQLNQFVSGFQSENNSSFFPLEIIQDDAFNYVLGTQAEKLFIKKFDRNGHYIGEKLIVDQITAEPENFRFSYSNGFFTLVGAEIKGTIIDSFTSQFMFYYPIVVSRFAISDWKMQDDVNIPLTANTAVMGDWAVLFPNPATEVIDIYCQLDSTDPFVYTITDLSGKTIATGVLDEQQHVRIQLQGVSNGLYFLYVQNGKNEQTLKFMKL